MSMIVVAAALIDADNAILIQQRAPGKHLAGRWEFPGGKVEPGEAAAVALARELAEELGIEVLPDALHPFAFVCEPRETGEMILLLYLCREWRGTPQAIDASALRWLTADQLTHHDLAPADHMLALRLIAAF